MNRPAGMHSKKQTAAGCGDSYVGIKFCPEKWAASFKTIYIPNNGIKTDTMQVIVQWRFQE